METLWIVELTFLKQRAATVYQVNNRSGEFFRVILVGQNMKQTLTRWSVIDFDEFTLAARKADAVSDVEVTRAIRHCYDRM
jgi:hypothetical protein